MSILNDTKMTGKLIDRNRYGYTWKLTLKHVNRQFTLTYQSSIGTKGQMPRLEHVLLASLDNAYTLRNARSAEDFQFLLDLSNYEEAEEAYKLSLRAHDGLTRLYGPNYVKVLKDALSPIFKHVQTYRA